MEKNVKILVIGTWLCKLSTNEKVKIKKGLILL